MLSVIALFSFFSGLNASQLQKCIDLGYKPCLSEYMGCAYYDWDCSTACVSHSDCSSNCCGDGYCTLAGVCTKNTTQSPTSTSEGNSEPSDYDNAESILVIVLPVAFGSMIFIMICYFCINKIIQSRKISKMKMEGTVQPNFQNVVQVQGMQNINMQMAQVQMYKQQALFAQQQQMFGNNNMAFVNQSAQQTNQNMMFNQNYPQMTAQGNVQFI